MMRRGNSLLQRLQRKQGLDRHPLLQRALPALAALLPTRCTTRAAHLPVMVHTCMSEEGSGSRNVHDWLQTCTKLRSGESSRQVASSGERQVFTRIRGGNGESKLPRCAMLRSQHLAIFSTALASDA